MFPKLVGKVVALPIKAVVSLPKVGEEIVKEVEKAVEGK